MLLTLKGNNVWITATEKFLSNNIAVRQLENVKLL